MFEGIGFSLIKSHWRDYKVVKIQKRNPDRPRELAEPEYAVAAFLDTGLENTPPIKWRYYVPLENSTHWYATYKNKEDAIALAKWLKNWWDMSTKVEDLDVKI